MSARPANHHATAIAIGADGGVLIRGAARSGKSALAWSALRRAELLGLPALLVADDQVLLDRVGDRLRARAPAAIAGRIELSGVGILAEPWAGEAFLSLVVDLAEPQTIERLPEAAEVWLLGAALRRLVLPAREASFGADVLQGLLMRPALSALTKS
jgi:HPr kinase/phosphorylase